MADSPPRQLPPRLSHSSPLLPSLVPESEPRSPVRRTASAPLLDAPLLDSGIALKPPPPFQVVCSRMLMFAFYSGLFMLMVARSEFILRSSCADVYSEEACAADASLMKTDAVQGLSTLRNTWINVGANSLSLISTSWLTAASDLIGRKKVLLSSSVSMLIGTVGMVGISWFRLDAWFLLGPSLVCGLGGNFGSFNAALFAFTADISTDAKARSHSFSILESCLFFAGVMAPPTAGWVMDHFSATAAFAAAATAVAIAVGLAASLTESVTGASMRRLRGSSVCATAWSPLLLVMRGAPSCGSGSEGHAGHEAATGGGSSVGLVCITFFFGFAAFGGTSTIMPNFIEKRFGMGPEAYGWLSSVNFGVKGAVLMFLLPLALSRSKPLVGLVYAIRFGLFILTVAVCLYGLAADTGQMFAAVAFEGFDAAFIPSTRALLSSLVSSTDQGKVLGLVANIEAVGSATSPLYWGYIYKATVSWYSPFVFYMMGVANLVAFSLSLCIRPPKRSAAAAVSASRPVRGAACIREASSEVACRTERSRETI